MYENQNCCIISDNFTEKFIDIAYISIFYKTKRISSSANAMDFVLKHQCVCTMLYLLIWALIIVNQIDSISINKLLLCVMGKYYVS